MWRWYNNVYFIRLIALVTFTVSFPAIGSHQQDEKISSKVAVSQTGRFQVNYTSSLILSSMSNSTNQFLTYKNQLNNTSIHLGPIPGDDNLNTVCSHLTILEKEKIADIKNIKESDIHYFNERQFDGCLINLNKNESALIISLPRPFTNSMEEKVKHIAVIANTEIIHELKSSISFQPSAEDVFINLLQMAQLESAFSKEINWKKIKLEGVKFINKETDYCMGLVAAQKFLIPELHRLDFHSLLFESTSRPASCSLPPGEDNQDENSKWDIVKALPEEQQEKIRSHIFDFHGYQLNKHISYFSIPGIAEVSYNELSEKIKNGRHTLKQAGVDNACGLIVDLRFSTGGNYFPMVLAVSSVLTNGEIFRLGKTDHVLLSNNGNEIGSLSDNNEFNSMFKYEGVAQTKREIPVAILINWVTGSSSNITSIVLRDNSVQSKVFGMRSSPTTSVNLMNLLLDGHTMNVMFERVYSRKGEVLPLVLPVDEEIADDYSTIFDPNKDLTIKAAQKWLESLPACTSNFKHESGHVNLIG